jgi:hypothetical protein
VTPLLAPTPEKGDSGGATDKQDSSRKLLLRLIDPPGLPEEGGLFSVAVGAKDLRLGEFGFDPLHA